MCGRFALYASENEIVSHFNLQSGFYMRERYNIAPSEMIPVIMSSSRKIEFCRWGFLPSWFKQDNAQDAPLGQINARIESITEKPFFKEAFLKQRCLIPLSGYYEWKNISGKKHPFYFTFPDANLFAIGGIFSTSLTCALLTLPARAKSLTIHPRMPFIIPQAHYAAWLEEKPLTGAQELFSDPLLEKMRIYAVSPQMNHPRFDSIACIESL